MTQQELERGDLQAVIAGHQLESHDPAEWLRYGVALLQTIEPGPDSGKEQQQVALVFVQAAKEGAGLIQSLSPDQVPVGAAPSPAVP